MTYISSEFRTLVIERAGNCCEYSLLSRNDSLFSFHVDHVIAEKHGGETEVVNLALSCPHCNLAKGSDIASIDRQTGALTYLFNPRTQNWSDHFQLDGAIIEPLSPEGRVTVLLLRLNDNDQVAERIGLMGLDRYPCRSS